jgi:hypothetical protein
VARTSTLTVKIAKVYTLYLVFKEYYICLKITGPSFSQHYDEDSKIIFQARYVQQIFGIGLSSFLKSYVEKK